MKRMLETLTSPGLFLNQKPGGEGGPMVLDIPGDHWPGLVSPGLPTKCV